MLNSGIHSVFVGEKPVPSISLDDWHARHNHIRAVASSRRQEVFESRNHARSLINETNIEARFITHENNSRLDDRVVELTRWLNTMLNCRDRLLCEIGVLRTEKEQTERELDALDSPLETVAQSLSIRNNRLEPELTYDKSGTELKSELSVVEQNRAMLREQCQKAWQRLNTLEDVLFKVQLDITNKQEAIGIDKEGLDLDQFCSNVAYKTDPMRAPKNFVTYDGWLEYSKDLKATVDAELNETFQLRESIFVCRETCRNKLAAQQDRTDHMLRRRIYETQRCRNELDWQLLKSREEAEKCLQQIALLEQCYADKCEKLKLAEYRLEHRTARSGMELCSDESHFGLQKEVELLNSTKRNLMEQINSLKTQYNALHDHCTRLAQDLDFKNQSLSTDLKCLDEREKTKNCLRATDPNHSQTGRNIQLSRMAAELPDRRFV